MASEAGTLAEEASSRSPTTQSCAPTPLAPAMKLALSVLVAAAAASVAVAGGLPKFPLYKQ